MKNDTLSIGVKMSWVESEKRETKIRFELRRLKNRAKSRLHLLVFAAFASALMLIAYKLSKKSNYKASIVIRVTEGSIYKENSPLAGQRMDEYLRSVTLTNTQMLDIVKDFSLYPLKRAKGCLLYTSPSPRDATLSRMTSSA